MSGKERRIGSRQVDLTSDFKTNPRPRLPGDARPQTPNSDNRAEWRDTWLEEAVRTALAAPAIRRRSDTLRSKHKNPIGYRAEQHKVSLKEAGRKSYKRDVSCPSNVELRPYADEPRTVMVKVKKYTTSDNEERQRAYAQAIKAAGAIINKEFQSGGLCVDNNDAIMVTPTCSGLPAIVPYKKPATASRRRSLKKK